MKKERIAPDTVEKLHTENDLLKQENAELKAKVNWYEEQIRLSRQKKFGSKSDRVDPEQLSLFNEAEQESDSKLEEPTIETITYKRRKKVGTRNAQLENLPEEVIEYHLSDEEKVCPCCNSELHEMSAETRREVKIIPAQAVVVKHVRHVYACRQCEKENITTTIVKAPAPKAPIPNGIASPSAIAFTMSQKYSEGMPLYRQEKYLAGLGIEISRQTMANWMIYSAEHWLKPLYERLHQLLVSRDILHADETTLQVLREDGRDASSQSYMWLYRTGEAEEKSIVLFDYRTTRASKHPKHFLTGFKGYLQTDGYVGYNNITNVTQVGCFAHARRYFVDALKAAPKESNQNTYTAEGLKFCDRLFEIEREIAELSPSERFEIRQTRSMEVLTAFSAWLKTMKPRVLPKSHLGNAITYCLNQWGSLANFIKDERLELSNNCAERSIKPFVIGRKNWLFSNTPKGAEASSLIYSIVETAKENRLIPFEYLKYLFEKLPNINITHFESLDLLLPWSTTLPQSCFAPKRLK